MLMGFSSTSSSDSELLHPGDAFSSLSSAGEETDANLTSGLEATSLGSDVEDLHEDDMQYIPIPDDDDNFAGFDASSDWGPSSSSEESAGSGEEADDEDHSSEEEIDEPGDTDAEPSGLSRHVHELLEVMYVQHYEKSCTDHLCGTASLLFVLNVLKKIHPDEFHEELCVSPYTFDHIPSIIASHPVFTNSTRNEQTPIEYLLSTSLLSLCTGLVTSEMVFA